MLASIEQGILGYKEKTVLQDVAFHAAPGEYIGLIGPNGAGKTTLLRTLAGIQPLLGGQAILLDKPLASYDRKAIAKILAYLPQERPLPFSYTAGEVVLTGRYPYLSWYAREGVTERELVKQALGVVGLSDDLDTPVNLLSGGQQQRVFFARILLQQAQLYILDEPTTGLDFVYAQRVCQLCSLLARLGRTVITSVHDLALAAAYCTRLILVAQGTILAQGIPADVLTDENLSRAYGTPCHRSGQGLWVRAEESAAQQAGQLRLLKQLLGI